MDILDLIENSTAAEPQVKKTSFDAPNIKDAFEDPQGVLSSHMLSELDDLPELNIFTGTIYLICKKKSFRADALYNLLSEEYKVEIIYTSDKKLGKIENALGFIIDITDFAGSKSATKAVFYINDIAAVENKPVFIIGEPEEIENTGYMFNRSDLNVIKFKRPIDAKQVIENISLKIATENIKERKKHVVVVDDSVTYLRLVKKKA